MQSKESNIKLLLLGRAVSLFGNTIYLIERIKSLPFTLILSFNRKILLSQLFLLKNDADRNVLYQHHLLYNQNFYNYLTEAS